MNRISLSKSLAYSIFIWLSMDTVSGQVSQKIGGNPGTIDPKAVLELESTTKGFLLPRMTATQMAAITNPTSGMIVFCTDCGVASDGELRISYNGVWQTYKGNVTGNVTGTAANVTGTVAVANGGTGATTATGALTNLGAAPIASPTFTGTVTAPIYASTPQTLTDAATINWNPASGLNASVTLGGNRTLSFTSLPAVGSYGTLIVTQDGTGNRTITLPTTANKVLGSASTTTIALSTAANAKDILNFYYDGTNCYWNIGQGYGTAAPAVITNLATGVSGTLPVTNGGTGATTLTGLVKGNGTGAMTAAVAGTDYVAPSGSITGNAATVTTNANLTGPITSSGNTTSVASQTGTGSTFVMNTSPTLVTPVLGSATATSINNTTIPTSKTLVVTTDKLNVLAATSSTELAGVISDETGTGSLVLSASPTFTGTPLAPTAAAGTNTTQVATTEFVTSAITTATIPDATTTAKGKVQLAGDLAGTAAAPTVPGLALKAPIASPTFTGTVTAPIYASTPQALTYGSTINWNPTNGLNASVTLGGNATLSFTSLPAVGSYGTLIVTQDATGNRTLTLPSTANKVLGSASTTTIALSTAANAKDILNFYYDGTNCYWNIGQGYGTAAPAVITNLATGVSGTLPVANGGTGAVTLTGLVKGNGTGAMTAAVAGTDYVAPSGSITGNAATVTTNANLTGPITSSGNTTSVASQTGTGSTFVMNTSPTLVTPVLGAATATSINNTTIPTSKTLVVTTDKLNVHAATSSSELASVISDETGTGSLVLSASPTFTGTPVAPTATAGTNTTQVATTEFVTSAIAVATIPDATTTAKGKIQLAGDLAGTAALPVVATNAITTSKILDANVTTAKIADANITTAKILDANVTTAKIADANVTDAKIATVSGSKVTGNITGSAANVTGTVAIANGGTGATTATAALANLTGTQAINTVLAGASSSISTLASYDGSSLAGFTLFSGGGVTVDGTVGNPGSSIKSDGGSGKSFYKDFGQNFKNKIIEFDIRLTQGTGGIAIGANSSGATGVGLRINTGTTSQNGLNTADTWSYPPLGSQGYTFNANTWYSIKIITDNGAPGGVTWYVNGAPVGNSGSIAIGNGTYFGFTADYSGTIVYIDNIVIKDNSGSPTTPTFRALVAADIPTLNQNTTGTAANITATTNSSLTTLSALSLPYTQLTGAPSLSGYLTSSTGVTTISGGTTGLTPSSATSGAVTLGGTLSVANGGTGATTATAALTNLGAAPIASPTFTGTVTAPIYASTPQALTYGSTINWNPTSGLNASVTLTGNGTLSFTSLPAVGSYGTLIVTQDATGNRILTLPTTLSNKVLGSASSTTITLSTLANAKDILNFYYDGTFCYWNIGQGYGTAAAAVVTNLATGVSGTLPVANGGTGATTLTGLVKGNGTGAMTAAVAGTDYVAPSGSITGNAANVTGTVAIANGGTGSTTQNFVDLTTNQTIAGSKTFSSNGSFKGQSIGVGNGTGSSNLAVGSGALNAASSGHRNTAIGSSAMQNYTGTGFDNNTSVGYNNLVNMTTGSGNTSVGAESMMAVTTGTANTSIGNQSLIGVTGNNNVGVGRGSGGAITTGSDNTMIGTNANVSVNNLSNATAIGSGAVVATSNTMQLGNTSVSNVKTSGTLTAGTVTYPNAHNSTAGQVLTTDASGLASWAAPSATTLSGVLPLANGGTGQTTIAGVKGILGLTTTNVAIGASSGTTSQGSGAVGVGNGTGQSNQGSQSVAIGYVAGNANQGANSVAIGSNAAQSGQGTQSVAIGIAANSSANNATAIGGYATAPHTNATAIGFQAATTANNTIQLGADGVTVAGSTAITNVKTTGTLTAGTVTYPNTHNSTAGQVLTVNAAGTATWAAASAGIPYTGATAAVNLGAYNLTVNELTIGKGNGSLSENTAFGKGVMANVTGNNNTSIGSQTMPGLQTGAANTAIGSAAGYSLTSGSNNIMMGYNANMSGNPSNSIAIGTNIDVSTSNTIQLGNSSSTTLKTYAKLNSGTVTYPNAHNSVAGQVLTTDAAGVASWASPSATSMSGVLPVANGGTGISTAPANGQIDIGNGTGFTRATLTAGSGITITNTAGTITITAAVRPTTDQPTTVSAGQTSFTLSQTPVNAKVWMFINGVRTNNNAYSISGTTVTYTPASNNGYVIVAGDRVQFDYCY